MNIIKKEVLLFCIILLLISLNSVYADEVGCCTNPGSGQLACSTARLVLRDKECCPKPESSFPGYYKSQQSPGSPANFNDCSTNFFFSNKACSSEGACALGCCCSELGGEPKSEAQCKGTGLIFHKGETNCNQICPAPQCNDGIDNDNNGCADNQDTSCQSPATKIEQGGSCLQEGVGCTNPNYTPKLSNLDVIPVKGEKIFGLSWKDECSENYVSYEILRCRESGCTNFAVIGTTNTNSFKDLSGDLLFDTVYTYQVKARYNLQAATPTIAKSASLGNMECLGQLSSNNFCIHESYYSKYKNYLLANFPDKFTANFSDVVRNVFLDNLNRAFSCDTSNKLVPEGTSCDSNQICVVNNNNPSCLSKISCNYASANPFGLFYTQSDCENDRYCFYDRSNTIVNSCFNCDPSMSCYDYKTEDTCTRDNCKVSNCKWKEIANQIGIGACVSTTEYNCKWCESRGTGTLENLRSFNNVFDFCTQEKSNVLSQERFICYFRSGKSKNCEDVSCKDYETGQCSSTQITHDENNKITNPSSDQCSIKVCQNINNACVKNADGDNKADCINSACESDYFAPNTTLLLIKKKGIVDSLLIQIYDRTSVNNSVILKTSSDYKSFLCVEPCGDKGHPYNTSTANRVIIIANLNVFDGGTGEKILALNEGPNVIRYYSQDPAKNLEEVKKITVEAHDNVSGPKILSINVTDGAAILGKIFTSNQKPTIDVQFFEPAIVTHSRLVNKNTGLIVPLQGVNELNPKASFSVAEVLPNGEYTFELNAKNKNSIFMDPQLSQLVIIDNSRPVMEINPSNGTVINVSIVTINISFNKEVNLDSVNINSEDVKGSFSTTDNKAFTASLNLSDGNKNIEISARDFAKNLVRGSATFIVDAYPTTIKLTSPRFGTASKSIFDVVVETDNDAACRFALDNNFEFEFMEPFTSTGATLHKVTDFSKIASGDTGTHKLNVRCKDHRSISFRSFDINVDTTPPQFKNAFAYPNPIIEKPSTTTLTLESDEPVICKFSTISKNFDEMEGKFNGYDSNAFKVINSYLITVEDEANYVYFVACMNKAELQSEVREIPFKVDLTIPISITSHTPEFFNSTNVVLALETNKKSQCKYSETDSTAQNGDIFGSPGYSHTRQLLLPAGKHIFYVVCKDQFLQKFSDPKTIEFTIDTTPPVILSVNDNSTLPGNPDFAWSTDNLRVIWNSVDYESRVSSHLYSIVESGTSRIVLNSTPSYLNNEWVITTKSDGTGLGLINGNRYFFRVRAQNIVGLSSNISESDGITIDTSLKPLNCTNRIKDEKESDVDCGSICDLCDIGKKCGINSDCRTNFCNNGLCSAPKCDDNVKNQDESDIDCGGSCKKCQPNKICGNSNDCESKFCSFGFCKPQESCSDGSLSPGESDIDCGGHCPAKCHERKNCNLNEDCENGLQCISSECKKCQDNDKNCNGIPDDQEEKTVKDSDKDGMPDEWELQNGLNPNDPNDAGLDSDKDGLTNLEEFNVVKKYSKSTKPNLADTDGDGFTDKEEIDKGTSPVDKNDFPKSNLARILSFVFGILILISGLGYLTYRVVDRKKTEKLELPRQKEFQRIIPQQPIGQAQQKQKEEAQIRENLKKKEEQKQIDREKLFGAFVKDSNAIKTEKQENNSKSNELSPKQASQKNKGKNEKIQYKKYKGDVFTKLKEVAGEERQKKQHKSKIKTQDRMEKLYELAKPKAKRKK